MENIKEEFHTVRGYSMLQQNSETLTPSAEDYLEMIYRLTSDKGYTRISDLAKAINVQPPSASKMVQKLSEMSFLNYEKYGIIQLTGKGRKLGHYLLKRHETVEQFLEIIGITEGILKETEAIEHNISQETLNNIALLVKYLKDNELVEEFKNYKENCAKE